MHRGGRLSSSSTVPLYGTPAVCLDRVLGSELGPDHLLVCRSRHPVEAGKQQGLEQEAGSEHEGDGVSDIVMSVCLSREADGDFSVLIPFPFLSCNYKEDALSKCGVFFARKLQWGF